jgi:pSer/pThr/pTyr-binding forkhead associated (FHA) protein
MALSVHVMSEDSAAPKLVFDLPRVVLGRSPSSDVRLPDPSVSQRHATIRQRGSEYILLDEGSTNGTFVGPVRLSTGAPRVLKNGDRVRLGRVWLEVQVEPAVSCSTPQDTRELALRLVAGALEADGESAAPKLVISAGVDLGTCLVLSEFQKPYSLGRSPECDLVLKDEDLSRRHAQVRRVGAEVLVRDLGSKNGSWLGEQPLSREQRWQPGQPLKVGKTQIQLEDPLHAALAKIEAAQDEVLDQASESSDGPSVQAPDEHAGDSDDFVPAPEGHAQHGSVPAPERQTTPPVRRQGSWGTVDVLVAVVALGVLGASVAGFLWLMGH